MTTAKNIKCKDCFFCKHSLETESFYCNNPDIYKPISTGHTDEYHDCEKYISEGIALEMIRVFKEKL